MPRWRGLEPRHSVDVQVIMGFTIILKSTINAQKVLHLRYKECIMQDDIGPSLVKYTVPHYIINGIKPTTIKI